MSTCWQLSIRPGRTGVDRCHRRVLTVTMTPLPALEVSWRWAAKSVRNDD